MKFFMGSSTLFDPELSSYKKSYLDRTGLDLNYRYEIEGNCFFIYKDFMKLHTANDELKGWEWSAGDYCPPTQTTVKVKDELIFKYRFEKVFSKDIKEDDIAFNIIEFVKSNKIENKGEVKNIKERVVNQILRRCSFSSKSKEADFNNLIIKILKEYLTEEKLYKFLCIENKNDAFKRRKEIIKGYLAESYTLPDNCFFDISITGNAINIDVKEIKFKMPKEAINEWDKYFKHRNSIGKKEYISKRIFKNDEVSIFNLKVYLSIESFLNYKIYPIDFNQLDLALNKYTIMDSNGNKKLNIEKKEIYDKSKKTYKYEYIKKLQTEENIISLLQKSLIKNGFGHLHVSMYTHVYDEELLTFYEITEKTYEINLGIPLSNKEKHEIEEIIKYSPNININYNYSCSIVLKHNDIVKNYEEIEKKIIAILEVVEINFYNKKIQSKLRYELRSTKNIKNKYLIMHNHFKPDQNKSYTEINEWFNEIEGKAHYCFKVKTDKLIECQKRNIEKRNLRIKEIEEYVKVKKRNKKNKKIKKVLMKIIIIITFISIIIFISR